jgi:hypothetical protein
MAPNRTSRQESCASGRNLKIIAKSSVTMPISNVKWMVHTKFRGALLGLAVGDALGTHYGNLPTVPDPRWQRAAGNSSSGRTICEAPRRVCGGQWHQFVAGGSPCAAEPSPADLFATQPMNI